jgi:hypothetical protein
MTTTPIAYIIFNRPRHTRETFASIKAQRPAKLFIIADGPRPEYPNDTERCREAREVVEVIDWPCDVQRHYADVNQGCKLRVNSGLNWVFSQVECAIVLEDDCLPHHDFYEYCDELLEYYKDDNRVMAVTGCNFQDGRWRGSATYYFSKYNHVWGWATWRRAWQKNDPNLTFWPEWKVSQDWRKVTPDRAERRYWSSIFDQMHRNEIDTWDYPWTASIWFHGGLTATPNINLVTNIGFGPDGTHTVASEDQDGLSAYPLGPLTHPEGVSQDRKADQYVFDHKLGGLELRLPKRLVSLPERVIAKILRTVRGRI